MKIHAILNRSGGTLKTTDLDMLTELLRDEFTLHGHEIEVEVVEGDRVVEAIEAGSRRADLDVLLVGGGDGTVSAAAAALAGSNTALAILPAGTMNLFGRSLQIPLPISQAVPALAGGCVTSVDIAKVDGKSFVHQFAVGLHARMVRARENLDYGSRIGKMWASTRAIASTMRSLPLVRLELEIDGRTETIESPAIAVSNNLYGDGHLPYADDPQGGELGVYICRTQSSVAVARLALDIVRGSWRGNDDLTVLRAQKVRIQYAGRKTQERAVRDGELTDLPRVCEIEMVAGGLKVLVPRDATLRIDGRERG